MTRVAAACLCAALFAAGPALAQIATTRHNLSVSGPGPAIAASESDICLFCHTPHDSSPVAPLWNRPNPGSSYTPYSSSTAKASPGQPTGASMLCLSCHDGTVAVDAYGGQAGVIFLGGDLAVGADELTNDHPISFTYDDALATQDGELFPPSSTPNA